MVTSQNALLFIAVCITSNNTSLLGLLKLTAPLCCRSDEHGNCVRTVKVLGAQAAEGTAYIMEFSRSLSSKRSSAAIELCPSKHLPPCMLLRCMC